MKLIRDTLGMRGRQMKIISPLDLSVWQRCGMLHEHPHRSQGLKTWGAGIHPELEGCI